jgi:DMSO/TMAO reductase YedYZ molybdopterin-dependent catalytic subunit
MISESQLPPSQVWGKKFVIYAALGIPRVSRDAWRLRVDGLVKNPLEFAYGQLTSGQLFRYTRSFHCVTKWSIKDVEWEGVQIRKLVETAGVHPDAKWVMFHCVDGYTAPVPLEDALHEDSIVAFKLNGKELTAEQGFPARPFMPHLYAWKSAKWLNRIEFIKDYTDGYWEMFGYHERANVWEEERFKGHVGKHSRRTAYGTA